MVTNVAKVELIRLILAKLNHDLELFVNAARTAHEAAIDEENQPDNKYDTTALEASYVAQGQANRAQELRRSIETYKQLALSPDSDIVRLTSTITLEDDSGEQKYVFIGPLEGGLKIFTTSGIVMVITPASPLGKALIGRSSGDTVEIKTGTSSTSYQIIEIT
jgi:transcription elongation GreA/GreB family factor